MVTSKRPTRKQTAAKAGNGARKGRHRPPSVLSANELHSLRARSTKLVIADVIRNAILSGRLPLGTQLSEKSLAEDLGVSRTPVREALMVLQSAGLVEVRPQSGTYVFSTSRGEITAICEMRLVLEAAAVRLALRRNHDLLIERLTRVVDEAEAKLAIDLELVHSLDTQFHRTLIEGSGNTFLIDAYRTISDRLHALRQLMPLTSTRLSNALDEHRRLINLLRAGDQRGAEKLIASHIEGVEVTLLSRLAEDIAHAVETNSGSRRGATGRA